MPRIKKGQKRKPMKIRLTSTRAWGKKDKIRLHTKKVWKW